MNKIIPTEREAGDWVAEGLGDKLFLSARLSLEMFRRVRELEVENAAMREAAVPFAHAFEKCGIQSYVDADEKFTAFLDRNQITPAVTMGDFRKLHAAIASAKEKGNG